MFNPIAAMRQSRLFGGDDTIARGRGGSRPGLTMNYGEEPAVPIGQGGFRNFSFPRNPEPEPEPEPEPAQNNASKFYQEMERLRMNQGPAVSAYSKALSEEPQVEDYKPNWLTRIAAGLSGFSAGMKDPVAGVQVAQDLNSSGYRNAVSQYTRRLAGLKEHADLERDDMKLQVQALKDAQAAGLNYEKYLLDKQNTDSQIKERARTNDIASRRADVAQQAAATAAAKAAQQDYNYVPVQGGFMAQNKNNPADTRMIPAKTIQDAQLQVARGHLKVAEKQFDLNEQLGDASMENTASLIATREGGAGNKFIPPAQQKTAEESVDQEMMLDPDYGKYYGKQGIIGSVRAGNNPFISAGAPVGPSNFTPEEWKAFLEERKARIAARHRVRR